MKELAAKVIPIYKEPNSGNYFDNLFRYQLVAQQYSSVFSSLDSVREPVAKSAPQAAKAIGFQFETYAAAKMKESQNNISFKEAYPLSFNELYNALPAEATAMVPNFFFGDSKAMEEKFYKLLKTQVHKDSIELEDAMMLLRVYNSWIVYSQIDDLAASLLAKQVNKNFIIEDSVLIKTRDGATLSATVIRKKDIMGSQPTVLMFNIYAGIGDKATAIEIAKKGYVGIVANTRGKYLSPQDIEPFEHDANDAYDIIDWVSKQSWSNGKVGMFGGSYLGFSQWAATKKLHPALKTIMPQVSVGIGIDFPMHNNIFMTYMLRWIHGVTNSKQTDSEDFRNDKKWQRTDLEYYKSGRAFNALDTIEGRPNNIFHRWLQYPSHDSYWQNMVANKEDFAKINIPVLTVTGYYDEDQLGAMYYYKEHQKYNKNPNHYLLIGPYDHVGAIAYPSPILRGYTIDSVAVININELAFKWFDYILKDSSRPSILKDKVNYEVMGTNNWKHVASLSKMNNDTLSFYFSNEMSGSDFTLSTKSQPSKFVQQKVDFKDRTDTSQPWGQEVVLGKTLITSNGLTFISGTFEKPFDINGAFTGTLMASINKKDMDVSIALYELKADGNYFTLSNFMGRASYTKDRSKRQLLTPGKIETIPYSNSFFVSAKISAGSKLVVVLGVNKNQYYQVNYGTGKDVSEETILDAKEPLEIKWYGNSSIEFPVYRY